MAAAEQLPLKLQRQLVQRLVAVTARDGRTTVVYLRQLSPQRRQRLAKLMDKNNEGQLSQVERSELKRLGAEVEHTLVANSRALARALRPELFDEQGWPIHHRFRQALRGVSAGHHPPRQKSAEA